MVLNFKTLINSFNSQDLKLGIDLLENEINIPPQNEEYDKFSLQGTISLVSLNSHNINRIVIQFLGFLNFVDCKESKKDRLVIENQLELLNHSIFIQRGTTHFSFGLILPRSLSASVSSNFLKLSYTISATIHYGNDQEASYQIPVQVYNSQLTPNLDALKDSFYHSGTIKNSIKYNLEFSKRLFTTYESVNFSMSIDSNKNAKVNYITVNLLQKGAILKEFEEGSENEVSQEISLAKVTDSIYGRVERYQTQFNLPISSKTTKLELTPSITSSHLEVKHTIQILINYQLCGQSPQIQYIQVPIAISLKPCQFIMNYPPTYNQIGFNSIHVPVAELPPVYSN